MAIRIEWSDEAKITYLAVLEWLNFKWSEKEALNFIKKTYKVLETISHQPNTYKSSSSKSIHKAL